MSSLFRDHQKEGRKNLEALTTALGRLKSIWMSMSPGQAANGVELSMDHLTKEIRNLATKLATLEDQE